MKILVTGATGFIGKNVINYFKNKNLIIGLSRSIKTHNSEFKIIKTDYSLKSLKENMKEVDAIIHLAAGRLNNTDLDDFQKNVNLDLNIFQIALELDIKNVIFLSSRGVYGSQQIPWHEQLEVQPENFYSLAKTQSELIAQFYIHKGLNIKILRAAQVLGIGEYEGSAISTFIQSAYTNRNILITVDGINREYLYIKDLLIAIELAIKNPYKNGVYNVGSGELVSLKKAACLICKAFNNQNLVIESIQKKIKDESLMDSSLFSNEFSWRPRFNFEEAAKDIATAIKLAKEF